MAIAARLRQSRRPVLACWATALRLHAFELDTAARYRLPIVTVIGKRRSLERGDQLQIQTTTVPIRTVGCELAPSRYDQLAAALGAHGEHVERADDLEPALDRALRSGLPAIINVAIEGLAAPPTPPPGSH